MSQPKRFKCLHCESKVSYENVGQWMRMRLLCVDCSNKGYRLELHTPDSFASAGRRWYVGVKFGGSWLSRLRRHEDTDIGERKATDA